MRIASLVVLSVALLGSSAGAQAPDPVGDYTWSFQMQDNNQVSGTMNIVRADTGWRATLTSDHTQGPIVAQAVTVREGHVIVYVTGDFGKFTLDMQPGASPIKASYSLVTDNGPSEGPITVERVHKSS